MRRASPDRWDALTFRQERLQDFLEQIGLLLHANWPEYQRRLRVPCDPDWRAYVQIENAGMLRCYTLREGRRLRGVAVFFVRPGLLSQALCNAYEDGQWLDPAVREAEATAFTRWCDEQLEQAGARIIYRHLPVDAAGPFLASLGYEPLGQDWARRVDGNTAEAIFSGKETQ